MLDALLPAAEALLADKGLKGADVLRSWLSFYGFLGLIGLFRI